MNYFCLLSVVAPQLVVNLFPVKTKQLPSAGRVKHSVKDWQKLTKIPMILDVIKGFFFILPPRQSRLPNLSHLIKKRQS